MADAGAGSYDKLVQALVAITAALSSFAYGAEDDLATAHQAGVDIIRAALNDASKSVKDLYTEVANLLNRTLDKLNLPLRASVVEPESSPEFGLSFLRGFVRIKDTLEEVKDLDKAEVILMFTASTPTYAPSTTAYLPLNKELAGDKSLLALFMQVMSTYINYMPSIETELMLSHHVEQYISFVYGNFTIEQYDDFMGPLIPIDVKRILTTLKTMDVLPTLAEAQLVRDAEQELLQVQQGFMQARARGQEAIKTQSQAFDRALVQVLQAEQALKQVLKQVFDRGIGE